MAFTIYVIHENQQKAFQCPNKIDFLRKILKNYGIGKDELVLIEKRSKKEISVDEISDDITVEIKTRHIVNGQRPDAPEETAHPYHPNIESLVTKLTENRALNGSERKWMINVINTYDKTENARLHQKRSREDEPVHTSNKKVQVELGDLSSIKTTSCTQTDLKTPTVDQMEPSGSSNVLHKIKLLAKRDKRDPEKVKELMAMTYRQRRNFILLQNPVVALVKEDYPLLFSLTEVRNELNRIFYAGKDVEVLSNIKKYSSIILSLVDDDDPLLNTVQKKIDEAHTTNKKQYAQEVGALLILSNVVKEKRLYLNTKDEPCGTNNYPRIETPCKVKDLFALGPTFEIIVENLNFCQANDFCEAVLCLLATFFIFNISYPDKLFNTFVVMERIFLEANDTDTNDIDDSILQIVKLIELKAKSNSTPHKK